MQITSFTLENYKAFADRSVFSVRPITLFFGYNSAGKSAALRFLKLLADSTSGDCLAPLNLGSEAVRGSDFKGLLSKYTSSPRIDLGLEFGNLALKYSILHLPELKTQIVESFQIISEPQSLKASFEWNPYDQNFETAINKYALFQGENIEDAILGFDGLVPSGYSRELESLLGPIAARLRKFCSDFVAISSDCIIPDRYYVETAPKKKISSRGEGIVQMLQAADDEVIFDISAWYQNTTGYSFQRSDITIGDRIGHRFTLHPNSDQNIDIDVVDTGEGMGQVLPVVSLLTLAKHNALGGDPVISLEHPELHIHPDAHSHLADLFCEVVTSNKSSRILVETHSENLLLGLQLAIAEGRVEPADVAVHWVRGTEKGAVVELVEFDDQARPSKNNWPIDVYRTNSKLARNLLEMRKAKKK